MKKFTGAILVIIIVFATAYLSRSCLIYQAEYKPDESGNYNQMSAPAAILLGQKIDVNSATKDDLEALPGIGPSLAERIVKYRALHGRFKNIDEMDNVSGIGPKTVERLKEFLVCHPERSEGSR